MEDITIDEYTKLYTSKKFYKHKKFFSLPARLDKYEETDLPNPMDLSLHNSIPRAIKVDYNENNTKIYYKSDTFINIKRNNSCEIQ